MKSNLLQQMENLNIQGLECQKQNQMKESIHFFEEAIKIKEHPILYYNMGNSYFFMQDYEKAIFHYRHSAAMGFDNPDLYSNLGAAYHKMCKMKNAEDYYMKSLSIKKDKEVAFNLSLLYRDSGCLNQSIDCLLKIVNDYPEFAEAYANLADLFFLKKEDKNSEKYAKKALELNPNMPDPWIVLGKIYMKYCKHKESLDAHLKALEIKGPTGDVLCNVAAAYMNLDDYDEALRHLKRAYDVAPNMIQIPLHLARIARLKGQGKEEIECYEKALQSVEPRQQMIAQKAIVYEHNALDDAMSLDEYKDLMIFYFNYAMFCFSKKQYKNAWPYYDLRWENPDCWGTKKNFHVPCLQNKQELSNPVFIWAEQGLGDAMMFANLLRNFEKIGCPYYLAVEDRLISLFSRSFHPKKIIPIRANQYAELTPPPDTSHHLPMGSLYRILDYTHFEEEVDDSPYLLPDPTLFEKMMIYKKQFEKPLVGISWKSFNPTLGPNRTLDTQALKHLLSYQTVTWISLQYSISSSEREILNDAGVFPVEPPVDVFNHIEGLAALLSVLDLTVSVDNTTAHLSAALGKDTSILLPRDPDWRWSDEGETTLWYRTASLFRQEKMHQWEPVVERVLLNMTGLFEHE